MLYLNFPVLFFVKSYKIPSLHCVTFWSNRGVVSYWATDDFYCLQLLHNTVPTPVWSINVPLFRLRNVTQRESGTVFFFRRLTQLHMSKLAPTAHQLSKKFIGYGHYELTISSSEGTKTIVTRNMDLIERLNSEIDKEKEEATAEAIALVLESSL